MNVPTRIMLIVCIIGLVIAIFIPKCGNDKPLDDDEIIPPPTLVEDSIEFSNFSEDQRLADTENELKCINFDDIEEEVIVMLRDLSGSMNNVLLDSRRSITEREEEARNTGYKFFMDTTINTVQIISSHTGGNIKTFNVMDYLRTLISDNRYKITRVEWFDLEVAPLSEFTKDETGRWKGKAKISQLYQKFNSKKGLDGITAMDLYYEDITDKTVTIYLEQYDCYDNQQNFQTDGCCLILLGDIAATSITKGHG
ncbi:hypothetical protein [Flavilitoribacter nigricans]|uniref:Uncharacterized protein n=1 Tax=Flavilitoribacter nigricans (strain ATCC 23147 / DSM 23189 / NBRC 102662 / NCIMB 1420 / SS-2) TaxID=1122177 RepID=A0A2D0N9P9_FLAN2|nr:hypothetical protein [Flavilitoribacter nigricans]PHN05100.1 hypothetical protein CRP01_18945 [Flavilitoribacter nigricans DSM 23189 = NBRC 102662]